MPGDRIDLGSYFDWYRLALERGWTEGLPVSPPTEERVQEVIDALGMDPAEVLGSVPPLFGEATVEQVAVNCVMAGCPPEAAAIVVAAVQAVLDPAFELAPVQVTTNACAPLVIVSGAGAADLGLPGGHGSFAGQSQALAGIGRALRLVLRNVGGALPGDTSGLVHGHPGWLSYAVAENVRSEAWPSFNTSRGFSESETCATVFFCQAPFSMYVAGTPNRILNVICATLPTPGVNMYFGGGQMLLAFAPKAARELASAGYSRSDVQDVIWRRARYHVGRLREADVFGVDPHTFYWGARRTGPLLADLADDELLPMVDSPDDIHVLVTGADGQWWVAFCAGWGEFGGSAVTRAVRWSKPRESEG
jgi:hypothetical protein